VSQRNAIYCIEHVKTRGMLALMNNDNTRHNFVDKTHFFLEITEQEPNADSSRVSISSTAVSSCAKDDFERFQSSEQHVDGCVLLARYDFLLVFYSDLGSMLNRCRVISR